MNMYHDEYWNAYTYLYISKWVIYFHVPLPNLCWDASSLDIWTDATFVWISIGVASQHRLPWPKSLHQTLVIKTDRDISSTKHPTNVSLVLWLTSFAKENPQCSLALNMGLKISGNGDIFVWVKIKNSCEDNKQQTNSILQNLWANFNQTWQKETLSKGFSYTNEGPCFYKWGDEIF